MSRRPWVQIRVAADATGVVRAALTNSTGGLRTPEHTAATVNHTRLTRFTGLIQRLAATNRQMSREHESFCRAVYQDILGHDIGPIIDRLRGQGGGPVLVQLLIDTPELRGIPWEAMHGPTDIDGALAIHPEILMVRGVHSSNPAMPREIPAALRILPVAIEGMGASVDDLLAELEPTIHAGEIEVLPPLIGEAARWGPLLERLAAPPGPHVLHLITHGRVRDGTPELLLDKARDQWVSARVLATALSSQVGDDLRLVYLESCSGADPGAMASAAEHLAARGCEAVVAHLWPVQAGTARIAARAFYSALIGKAEGDVARALNSARLAVAGLGTADFLCPVLTLRGTETDLFDFSFRMVAPLAPNKTDAVGAEASATWRALAGQLRESGTLVLGHRLHESASGGTLRQELENALRPHPHIPLDTLMQRFELNQDREELDALFQEVLDGGVDWAEQPKMVDQIARIATPGLVVTDQWLPWVERAIALHHPKARIVVFQPLRPGGIDRLRTFVRDPGQTTWARPRGEVDDLDFSRDFAVLRVYGGYAAMSHTMVGSPVLTEDDQLMHLARFDQLPTSLLAFIRTHPVTVVGIDPLKWSHREILRRLMEHQPLPAGSMVVLPVAAAKAERQFWTSRNGPGGRAGAVEIIELEHTG